MRFNIIVLILITLISCDIKDKSIGPFDRVIVFGNSNLYDQTIDSVRKYMGMPRELPIEEDMFEFEYRPLKEFDKFKTYRNIMFLISNESPNEYNQLSNKILSQSAKEGVKSNNYNMFLTKDLYASNQSVLLLVTDKDQDLKNVISDQVSNLVTFDNFIETVYDRYSREIVYGYNHVEATEKSLIKQHGYSIDHSKFYKAVDNISDPDSNIVSFFAPAPVRWYWVKYFENVENKSVDTYLDLRDKTCDMHFEGDDVDRLNKIYTDSLIINGNRFLKIQSTYITYDDGINIGGGPAITYVLNKGNRTYLIDGSVFKPGNRKTIELIQLETIMRTFKLQE